MAVSSGCCVGYVRVSTQEQADSGLGLAGQRTQIETAAARLGLTLSKVYCDGGLSGSLGIEHRRGLADALNALQPGDTLLVAKRDRLARDSFLTLLIEREAARKGARIVSAAGEGTETDDPAAVFTRRILDAVAELERSLIAARTRAAMREARRRGQVVGRIPYGHRLRDDGSKYLELDEPEQAILAEIRMLRARGVALADIAETLNARGLRNRAGRTWRRQFVGQLLERHP